jgi:hypothetical protein
VEVAHRHLEHERLNSLLDDIKKCKSTDFQAGTGSVSALGLLVQSGFCPGEIEQHHIRMLLLSFEDNFTTVRGDVEVANVEIGRKVG